MSGADDEGYVPLIDAAAIAPGRNKAFVIQGHEILVCNVDGGFYALHNRCSHAAERLEGGRIRGHCVVCPLHGARFDVRDGRAVTAPARTGIPTYPLRIVDGRVEVRVDPQSSPAST